MRPLGAYALAVSFVVHSGQLPFLLGRPPVRVGCRISTDRVSEDQKRWCKPPRTPICAAVNGQHVSQLPWHEVGQGGCGVWGGALVEMADLAWAGFCFQGVGLWGPSLGGVPYVGLLAFRDRGLSRRDVRQQRFLFRGVGGTKGCVR